MLPVDMMKRFLDILLFFLFSAVGRTLVTVAAAVRFHGDWEGTDPKRGFDALHATQSRQSRETVYRLFKRIERPWRNAYRNLRIPVPPIVLSPPLPLNVHGPLTFYL